MQPAPSPISANMTSSATTTPGTVALNSPQQQPALSTSLPAANPGIGGLPGLLSPASALEHCRLSQLYQYAMAAERFRCPPGGGHGGGQGGALAAAAAFFPTLRPDFAPFLYSPYYRFDARLALCRPPEEPKPQHSYIGLIAMAILSHPDKKLVLSDIYQYILDNYPYFRTRGPGWRNSIRHNLSLNDCFIKAGRSANGKGHYWAIHQANLDDFQKGDFRRRKAQRKVRKHMGLAVDDEDSPSPPPSTSPPPPINWPDPTQLHPLAGGGHPLNRHFPLLGIPHQHHGHPHSHPNFSVGLPPNPANFFAQSARRPEPLHLLHHPGILADFQNPAVVLRSAAASGPPHLSSSRHKRQFDVASLLAPEKYERERDDNSGRSEASDEGVRSPPTPTPSPPHHLPFPLLGPRKTEKKLAPASEDDEEADDEDEDCCEPIEVDEDEKHPPSSVRVSSTSEDESNGGKTPNRGPALVCQNHHFNGGGGGKIGSSPPQVQQHPHPGDHHLQQQAPQMSHHFLPGFHPSPNHLLHNSSLASLMILSSRYRELTSGLNSNSGGLGHAHAQAAAAAVAAAAAATSAVHNNNGKRSAQ